MWKALSLAILLNFPALVAAQSTYAKELDARLENQLYDVMKLGTDIYNRGGHDACFRLYQGSLMTALGFLEHRPDSVDKIKKALSETDGLGSMSERAHVLRGVMDELRAAIKSTYASKEPTTSKPLGPTTPVKPNTALPLWNRLGGEDVFKPLVNEWIDRALKNPRVNFTRRGTGNEWEANPENIKKVKKQMLDMISAKTGGPLKYTGKEMKPVHATMKIAASEFDALVEEFSNCFEKHYISQFERAELLKVLQDTRNDIVDSKLVIKPLWDRLGGEVTVTIIVDDFIARVSKNPSINFSRKGLPQAWAGNADQVAALQKKLIHYFSSVSGGPHKYAGKSMKDAHAQMQITEAEFNALVVELKVSLELYKINEVEREELLHAVRKTKSDIVTK